MKKMDYQPQQNDSVIEALKPQKESRSAEKRKERQKLLFAALSAINLSGCGAFNEIVPSLGMLDFKTLDSSKLEQSEIVKTPQLKEIERTLQSAGYTDKQINSFQSEYTNGCIYGETGGKKILSPVFSSQMLEGEMRLYVEPPTRMIEAGYTTPETFNDLLQEEARELTIRLGYSVKIVSTPEEANQIIHQSTDLGHTENIQSVGGSGQVSGKAEDLKSKPQYIEGLGKVFVIQNSNTYFSTKAFLDKIEPLHIQSSDNKYWVFNKAFKQVTEHEIIHNQGMMHTPNPESIMYPVAPETWKGTIDPNLTDTVDEDGQKIFNVVLSKDRKNFFIPHIAANDPVSIRMQGMKTFLDIKRSQRSTLDFLNPDHV